MRDSRRLLVGAALLAHAACHGAVAAPSREAPPLSPGEGNHEERARDRRADRWAKMRDGYVIVEGVVYSTCQGHMDMFQACIGDVTRLEPLRH
jgi:hypothetical protein